MVDEIISEPSFREETVIDIDVSYPSGVCQFTLRGPDTYFDGADQLKIVMTAKTEPAPSPEEDIVLLKSHMEYYSIRKRVIKWPLKKPITAPVDPPFDSPASES